MPTPPHIVIETLLMPIDGDSPAGSTVPFILRKKMDDARKEVNPDSFAADDPRRPEQPVVADWPVIQQMAVDALTNTSKDLMLAARLTEALTKQYGFSGARDGFQLLRRLVDECWDRINPVIEDGDLEPRAAAFNWLADPDRGAFYPNTMRHVPIVHFGTMGYGWQHWRDLQDGKAKIDQGDFDKAIAAVSREECVILLEDLTGSLSEIAILMQTVDAKMGDAAPSLVEIRRALLDGQTLAQEILARKGPAPNDRENSESSADTSRSAGDGTAANGEKPVTSRRMNTREEVYARLAEAADQLMKMEPHSPVAYMIQRAVKLGHLSLPELMRVLVRDSEVLKQLNRDLDLGFDDNAG